MAKLTKKQKTSQLNQLFRLGEFWEAQKTKAFYEGKMARVKECQDKIKECDKEIAAL